MNQYIIANRIKDLSRAIYILSLSGKVADNDNMIKLTDELEEEISSLRKCISLEQSGFYQPKSDLKGLAAREALR